MRERALPVGPVARDASGHRNALGLSVLIERTGLLGLIEERDGFHREMGPVIGVRIRLEAPLADRLQLVVAVLPHSAELQGRESFRLTAPRSLGQFPAPCPAHCFR